MGWYRSALENTGLTVVRIVTADNKFKYRSVRARDVADARDPLEEAAGHLDKALEHHAKGLHSHVKDCINDAQRSLQRAIGAKQPTPADVANPTGWTGAQTSSGQSSRSLSRSDRLSELDRLLAVTPDPDR